MEHTVAGAIKEWRKHNKVIGQVKISYKKFYENAESSRSQEVNTENIKDFVPNISARG
jgi:hypothetical protein